ncbi:CpsD/CapB family tyrosine-protein kinase [bacterium]|nr:CpsD/CapB family tyrosine-protein kinase [bacterium]
MERIQEAIEKARRERQGEIGGSPSERQASAQSKAADSSSSIRIQYSKTRSISLNEAELKDRRIVAGFAHDQRSEPYRQLRGQILKKFRENNWQTLAITSPNAGGGKTLTAVNLAISLSLETNQTVLLVDLDLRDPGVAPCLGIHDVQHGIVDYIKGEVPLSDILINPGYERLVVLPGTPQGAFTSEILSSPEMRRVQEEIVSRYPSRLVVFDLPAVLSHDDALTFAPSCDAVLMVIEEGGTQKADAERAMQLLDGCNIIGSVLNKVRYV